MIYLGSDHAGFELKEEIKAYLKDEGREIEDLGAFALDPDDDYPDYVIPVARKVALRQAQGEHDVFGIVFGLSGQGEAIGANKVKGIRASVYYGGSLEIVKLSRLHNNANVLSLGARFLTKPEALKAVQTWLETPWENGRHKARIDKISKAEE